MSSRNTVTFRTSLMSSPSSERIPSTFESDCSACAAIGSSSSRSPLGVIGICPAVNTISPFVVA